MRRRSLPWIAAGVVAAGLVAGAVLLLGPDGPWDWPWADSADAAPEREPVTADVEWATLTSQLRLNAQLGYGDAVPLPAANGMITALPAAGQVVETGQPVVEVDGGPVVLFRGARPFWRDLTVDSTNGEDVRQLEQNLAALGFFADEPDARYDWVTRQAVRDWQSAFGFPVTGEFSAASVMAVDAPSIRIARVTARLGEAGASPGTYTETRLRAAAKLTAAQARELVAGTPVTVVLPGGAEIEAALSAIDPGGVPTGEGSAVTPPYAFVEFPDQSLVAAAGQVAVRLVIRESADQPETLVVPVTALLALPGGGYAVEVLDGEGVIRVPVEIGLVADARAQVLRSGGEVDAASNRALEAGDRVVLAR